MSIRGVIQRLCDVWYHNRPNTEAYMRTKLSSMKPDIKEIYKKYKAMLFFLLVFCFEKYSNSS